MIPQIHLFKKGTRCFIAKGWCRDPKNPDSERPLKFDPNWGILRQCNPGEEATTLRGEVEVPIHFVALRQQTLELAVRLRFNSLQRELSFWADVVCIETIRFYRLSPDGELTLQANF